MNGELKELIYEDAAFSTPVRAAKAERFLFRRETFSDYPDLRISGPDFNNGFGFYNALRYNGKKAVLLAYPGEGHGLRGMANRRDLTIRFFQFFDHYLKDAPAPTWMTDGVPFLKKDEHKDSTR